MTMGRDNSRYLFILLNPFHLRTIEVLVVIITAFVGFRNNCLVIPHMLWLLV